MTHLPEHPLIKKALATGYPWTNYPWPQEYYKEETDIPGRNVSMTGESNIKTNGQKPEKATRKSMDLNAKLLHLQTTINSVCENNSSCSSKCSADTAMGEMCKQRHLHTFKKAKSEAGLCWKLETLSCDFLGGMLMVNFRASLIDPNTGEREEYLFSGMGEGENAISNAFNRGFEFFINSNFRLCPEKKHSVTSADMSIANRPADLSQIEAIAVGLERLCESGASGSEIEAFQETITEDMTWHDAQSLIDAINRAADSR